MSAPLLPIPTSSWAVQFICTLHLPINSYLSSHAGLLLGDCINQCGPSDNSYTSATVSVRVSRSVTGSGTEGTLVQSGHE